MSNRSHGPNLRVSAKRAWLWGVPLIEMAQQRYDRAREGYSLNQYQHQRKLMDASESFVTTPNNDTLYSQAWINLDNGPVKLTIPPLGGRYFSLALMDMYTNNFAVLGTRTIGDEGGTFTLVGPLHPTDDRFAIRAPTPWVCVFCRTLVENELDVEEATRLQDKLKIDGMCMPGPGEPYATRSAPWQEYFASVQLLMNENPPPATDFAILREIEPLVRVGGSFDQSRFSKDDAEKIRAGIADAHEEMIEFRGTVSAVNGWSTSNGYIGAFKQSYTQRATTAIGGLLALPREEATYFSTWRTKVSNGFDSSKDWKLTFGPEDLPPVQAFWSLSVYRLTADGQKYFVDNALNRYAIGDRTPGLKRGSDGSLSIWLMRSDPGGDATSNWLPTPSEGRFVLSLRAYIPHGRILDGQYRVPEVGEV